MGHAPIAVGLLVDDGVVLASVGAGDSGQQGIQLALALQAVQTASSEPGSTKITVPLATPARQRLCRLLVPIVSNDSTRNSSPKPSIVLSSRGPTASGLPSRPVRPVPPELITTCTAGSAIQ